MRMSDLNIDTMLTINLDNGGNKKFTTATVVRVEEKYSVLRLEDPDAFHENCKSGTCTLLYTDANKVNWMSIEIQVLVSKSDKSLLAVYSHTKLSCANDRRAYNRYSYTEQCTLKVGNSLVTCTGIDISQGGLAVMSESYFHKDDKMLVNIYNPYKKKSRNYKVEIVACSKINKGFRISMKFLDSDEWLFELINVLQDEVFSV